MPAVPALVITGRAGQASAGLRAAGTYAVALALVVITITGLLAAVILAR